MGSRRSRWIRLIDRFSMVTHKDMCVRVLEANGTRRRHGKYVSVMDTQMCSLYQLATIGHCPSEHTHTHTHRRGCLATGAARVCPRVHLRVHRARENVIYRSSSPQPHCHVVFDVSLSLSRHSMRIDNRPIEGERQHHNNNNVQQHVKQHNPASPMSSSVCV